MTDAAVIDTQAPTGAVHPDHILQIGMGIEVPGGFDYTGAQFDTWARRAGFGRTGVRHLAGPTSAAIAYKD